MLPVLISLATLVSTLLGGLFALRFSDRLHLVLGFSAGALLGVAFFDLLPESLSLSGGVHGNSLVTGLTAVGFLAFLIIDRIGQLHMQEGREGINLQGKIGAAGLTVHSFLDGLAIGLAFQVSSAVGIIVSVAVLVHDFSDGINTVSFVLSNQGQRRQALTWLLADATAPVLGALSTLFFHLPEQSIGLVLALFAGFFLYIGACDLLPESFHRHRHTLTTVMTLLGAGTLFAVVQLANR